MKSGVHFDDSGFRKLRRKLREVKEQEEARIDEVLTPEFMQANTPWSDVNAMAEAAGFEFEDAEDFERKRPQLDAFIARHSRFSNVFSICSLRAFQDTNWTGWRYNAWH